MEGRKRSRARKRRLFSPKRLTSFLLAAAMICTNIGSDLSTAYAAGSSTDVSFEMRGSDLVTAIEDAIATENVVTPDDLNFTNGKVDDFEGFLFGEGKLYEAYPEMEGGDVDADMRVFVRLPEDADDMYAVTGDEEVIFLYINNSDETVRFRSLINYTKDGEDKVKKTDWVSVRSYESVYGDEEVNVIPDQPETEEPAETPETTVPETEAPVDETTEAPAEEDPIATDSEMTVSMSPNVAALVAAPGDDDAATPSEITGGEETADEPETTAPEESNEGLVDEGNLPEESDPATTPEESQPAEETTPVEETTEVPETTAPAKDPVATEDEIQSAPKPDYSDLVGIGWSGTGKIYTSTLNKLHAFDDVEGWKVEYSITPEGSARIIDGARGVEDGEDLYFGVKNQIGYAVESVLANGEELTADTITDNEDGSQTAWYAVYGVTEEQSIDVVMAETENSYKLTINHILEDEAGIWGATETVYLSEEDFSDGLYDTAQNEYVKEGMEFAEAAPVISTEEFSEERSAAITLNYQVKDGWRIVEESADDLGISPMSVYIGDLDTVVIQPEDGIVVTIQFSDSYGIPMGDPAIVAIDKTDSSGQYQLEYTLSIPEGYTASTETGVIEDGVLTANFDANETEAVINVTYTPQTVSYSVEYYYQNIEDDSYTWAKEETDTESGEVGSLTNVIPETKEGFTAQTVEQQVIQAAGTVVQVKYDRNVYTLLYNTNGGSYIPSEQAKYGSEITLDGKEPTRQGYQFDGWYEDEGLTNRVHTVTLENDPTMVYAKWTGDMVDYRMVYLTENANDDGYSYVGTVTDMAKAGETVQATKDSRKPEGFDTQHFTFESSDSAVVSADGSTVITVKYSRNEYTITFGGTGEKTLTCNKEEHTHSFWCGNWIGQCDKEEHSHSVANGCYDVKPDLSITAKYEQNISDQWLDAVGPGTPWEGQNWLWDEKQNQYTGFQEKMPGENKYLTTGNNGNLSHDLYYYVEDPQGNIKFRDKTFTEKYHVVLKVPYSTNATYDEEFFPIDGYERFGSNIDEWWNGEQNGQDSVSFPWGDTKFYYIPEEYTLSLVDGNSQEDYAVPYGSDISEYTGMEGLPEGNVNGTFAGWYIDPEFETLYAGDNTMPKGLVLYAKRQGEIFTVTFKAEENSAEEYYSEKVESGKTVEKMPGYPSKEGYIFDGWYVRTGSGELPFDQMSQITANITVYAKWIPSTTIHYTVYHQTPAGENIVKPVEKTGKVNATVQERALSADQMPGAYAGYVPDQISQTITLTPGETHNIIFVYDKATEFRYIVQYVYNGDVIQTDGPETVQENVITVYAKLNSETLSEGYEIDGTSAQRVVLTRGENVVTFPLKLAEYDIMYNLNGGTNNSSNPTSYKPSDLKNEPITILPPTRDGYTFAGWKLAEGEVAEDSADHNPMQPVIEAGSYGNLIFEAQWKKEVTLTYTALEGGTVELTSETFDAETGAPQGSKAAADTGWKFVGWYDNENAEGSPVSTDGTFVPEKPDTGWENANYYAKFERTRVRYGREIYLENLNGEYEFEEISWTYGDVGETVTSDVKNYYRGFTFNSDLSTKEGVVPEEPDQIVLKWYYDRNEYTVSYELQKNAYPEEALELVPKEKTYKYGETVKVEDLITVKGYTFGGWYVAEGLDGQLGEHPESFTMPDNPVLLKGMFTVNKDTPYKVDHYLESDSGEYELKDTVPLSAPTDTEVTAEVKEYKGYTFDRQHLGNILSGTVKGDGSLVLKVYYSRDVKGEEDPDQPDGIPDKYQVTVTYTTDGNGYVTSDQEESVTEIVTLYKNGNQEEGYALPGDPTAKGITKAEGIEATAKPGYAFANWTQRDSAESYSSVTGIPVTGDTTFIANFKQNAYELLVEHVYLDKEGNKAEVFQGYSDTVQAGNPIAVSPRNKEGFTLDYFVLQTDYSETVYGHNNYDPEYMTLKFMMPASDTYVRVFYFEDQNSDKVPDQYQVEITYITDGNGYVNAANEASATEMVTLYLGGDPDMGYAEPGSEGAMGHTAAEGISAAPKTGYDFVNWTYGTDGMTENEQPAGIEVTGPMTIKANFKAQSREWYVLYYNEDGKEIRDIQQGIVSYGDAYDLTEYIYDELNGSDGYHYAKVGTDGSDIKGTVSGDSDDVIWIKVIYSLDEIGEENPDKPDGVADKYQTVVTFGAVNGIFDETGTTYTEKVVTLRNADGQPAESGTYRLQQTDIPGAAPVEGYRGGSWEPNPYDTEIAAEGNKHFVITFVPDEFEARVEYYFDGEKDEDWTKTEKYLFGDVLDISEAKTVENDGKQYAWDWTEGDPLTITADESANVIKVYYSLDENGDAIPDKYQDIIVFAAVNGTFNENGTTQLEKVITYTDDGTAAGKWDVNGKYTLTEDDIPEATAAAGYTQESLKWDEPNPLNYTIFSRTEEGQESQKTFIVRFTGAAEQTYTVQYIDEDTNEGLLPQAVKTAPFGSYIKGEDEKVDIPGYAYTRATDLLVTEHNESNYVFVYYSKDAEGPEGPDHPDGHPDKYQIVFTYVSADENTGTVTGTTREVYTFKDAAGNYVENTGISPNAIKGHNPVADPAENYAFHYWTVQGQEERDYTVGMTFLGQKVYTTDTTFVAHFAEDKINDTTDGEDPNVPEDPNQPDGIPDIYQIVFTYVTEDATHGTVDGMVTEVRTFPRNGETGEYDTTAAISPNVGVTITTIGRYRFDNWTNGAGTVYDTDDLLRAAGFTEDQTFTAHFYRLSGGGSSGGGGGTSTPGGPYNPGAGPGVTITEPEVPLAPLPTENGGSTVIFDDNVPLAPLPKTGQQSLKTPITMLLAGIFLAFASLTKRKEEN